MFLFMQQIYSVKLSKKENTKKYPVKHLFNLCLKSNSRDDYSNCFQIKCQSEFYD